MCIILKFASIMLACVEERRTNQLVLPKFFFFFYFPFFRPRGHYAIYLHKSCTGIGSCIYDYESKTIANTRNVIYMNEQNYPGLPNVDPAIQSQYLSPYQCLPLSDIFPDIQVTDPNNDPHASEFPPSRLHLNSTLKDYLASHESTPLTGVNTKAYNKEKSFTGVKTDPTFNKNSDHPESHDTDTLMQTDNMDTNQETSAPTNKPTVHNSETSSKKDKQVRKSVKAKKDSTHKLITGKPSNSIKAWIQYDPTKPSKEMSMRHAKKQISPTVRRHHLKQATRNSKTISPIVKRLRSHRIRTTQVNAVGIEGSLTPKSYKDAMEMPNFVEAMNKELEAHRLNHTWSEMELPDNVHPLKLKWVFSIKTGNLAKARLVARGDMQREDTYEDTYSPTCNAYIFRLIFSMISQYNWEYIQMDISTAYLNAKLDKDIYVYPPQGYKAKGSGHVLKLNKALYGLKQSGRLWNITIDKFLKSIGFKSMTYENLYGIKQNKKFVLLVLYVDDILMTGNSNELMEVMRDKIKDQYKTKTLPGVHMMGLDILRDKDTSSHDRIVLSGASHINKLVSNYAGTLFSKEVMTPLTPDYYFDPSPSDIDETDPVINRPFKQVIGELNYISASFRPDIAYATNYLAQISKHQRTSIWYQLKRVMNYLHQTRNIGISYTCDIKLNPMKLRCFCDANFASNPIDRKSQSGIVFMTNGPIFWKSNRQSLITQSSTHAEYVTLADASNYGYILLQVLKFITQISGMNINSKNVTYYEDNQSCIKMAESEALTKRGKFIDLRWNIIKDRVARQEAIIKKIGTEDQVADILTKPTSIAIYDKLMPYILGLEDYQDLINSLDD